MYVLEVLQQKSVYAKKSLCEFGMSENLYIGRIVFNGSVFIMMIKIKAMRQWPVPSQGPLHYFGILWAYAVITGLKIHQRFVGPISQRGFCMALSQ